MRRLLVGAPVLTLALIAGMASPGIAASAWTIQATPNPQGATYAVLNGVACPGSGNCEGRSTSATLVLAWNGSKWSIQTSPNAKGADLNELYGVACPGSTCQAVGWDEKTGSHTHTLALTWNGSKWKIVKSANPGGLGRAALSGISCMADSLCVAAGDYDKGSSEVTLVETWNGSRWTVQKSPNPNGANSSHLQSVACMSIASCTAVGYSYGQSSIDQTLVESWNGTKWSIESSPNPPHSSDSLLGAVAYRSATTRTAVGYFVADSGNPPPISTLAEGSP